MILFQCLIEVNSHGILKNNKQIFYNKKTGRNFITSSNNAKTCQNILNAKLLQEKLKQGLETIAIDVNMAATFFYPSKVYWTKALKRSQRVGDLSNLYELPQDCMQRVGILSNDSLICSHNGSSRQPIDEDKYLLHIVLTKV